MGRQWIGLIVVFAMTLVAMGMAPAGVPGANPPVTVKPESFQVTGEKVVARIPAKHGEQFRLLTNFDFSQVGAIDTWKTDEGATKWYICMNSVLWEFYDQVDAASGQFTMDGQHFLVLAGREGKAAGEKKGWFLVRDNQEIRVLGEGACDSLVVSRDAKHDALVQHGVKSRVVLDGKALGEGYDEILSLRFSDDSAHVGFIGQTGGVYAMVVDGKVLGEVKDGYAVSEGVFSGEHWCCGVAGYANGGARVDQMVDGKAVKSYPLEWKESEITSMAISRDGSHVAWGASILGTEAKVFDDGISKQVSGHRVERIALSDNNAHIAFEIDDPTAITLFADFQQVETGLEKCTGVEFVQSDHLRFCSAVGVHDYFLTGTQWPNMRISASTPHAVGLSNVEALTAFDQSTNPSGTFLGATSPETGRAYIISAKDGSVIVGDKQLLQITRVELKSDR